MTVGRRGRARFHADDETPMTRRPPADPDEDTLIMRRPRVDRAGGKRRSGLGSPATWLGLAMLAIMLAGAAAWVWRGAESPATQQVVAVAQPPQAGTGTAGRRGRAGSARSRRRRSKRRPRPSRRSCRRSRRRRTSPTPAWPRSTACATAAPPSIA